MPEQIVAQPTVQALRARNRADQRRVHAIVNVMERLEVWSLIHEADRTSDEVRREHAANIVDAVLALMRGGEHQ